MSRRLQWIIGLVVVAGIGAVVAIGLSQSQETKHGTGATTSPLSEQEVREKLAGAPPALASLHQRANAFIPGGRKALKTQLADLKGHPVVVNVWGSWCGPCRVELPILQQASLDWGKQIAFLGVDTKDNRDAAKQLLKAIPVTYPSIDDGDAQIFNDYKTIGAPTTVYYNAAGEQTYLHQGPYQTREQLDADIERYAL